VLSLHLGSALGFTFSSSWLHQAMTFPMGYMGGQGYNVYMSHEVDKFVLCTVTCTSAISWYIVLAIQATFQ